MKANRILLLCSAAALPQLAMADLPSPQSLGTVNAILTFCAQVDPRDAKSFQQEWKSVVGGTTDRQLDGAENGGAYKQAFDAITAELKKLSGQSVASACAIGAASWRGGDSVASSGKGDGDGSSGKGNGGSSSGKGDGGSTSGKGDGGSSSGKGDGDGSSGKGNGGSTSGKGDGGSTSGKGDGGSTSGKIEPKNGKDRRDASRTELGDVPSSKNRE